MKFFESAIWGFLMLLTASGPVLAEDPTFDPFYTKGVPLYSISRGINPDGTVAKETNGRNFATRYTYDKNLRLTKVTPPLGSAVVCSYPADSSYRKATRGSFYTTTYFDGFGRPTGTLNSKGVRSDIDYKAYGSKNFTDSNVGDQVYFDALGRPIQAVHKDNTSVQYVYSGNTVTFKDEANNSTVRAYNAFGSPDPKRLVAVQDANGHTARYNYNILGLRAASAITARIF